MAAQAKQYKRSVVSFVVYQCIRRVMDLSSVQLKVLFSNSTAEAEQKQMRF
jgi:hypothetical protein